MEVSRNKADLATKISKDQSTIVTMQNETQIEEWMVEDVESIQQDQSYYSEGGGDTYMGKTKSY